MCGIAGFLSSEKNEFLNSIKKIDNIKKTLFHRGPNFSGHWFDKSEGISLIHTRLSIQDLSSAGNQPMFSKNKRYCIIYNGEIYNHLDLRKLLKSNFNFSSWKGTSDTETLLSCFDYIGIKKTLDLCVGMFSIAIWDLLDKQLYLIRDRFGEKPLYFGIVNTNFVFSSELKAIKKITEFSNEICRDSLNLFLRFAYIPSPKSIYKNIFKLEPGSILKINYLQLQKLILNSKYLEYKNFDTDKWWDAKKVFNKSINNLYSDTKRATIDVENALIKSINSQLISDVPLGAFLSGGVDSSLIVSILKKKISNNVSTFTIGFKERLFDESIYAKKIANYLGTDHNELILSSKEALKIISSLGNIYDEPFADSSQIPTILISQFAKQKITVSLTGDGGDELFGGYNRYIFLENFWKKISLLPFGIRKTLARLLGVFSVDFLNNFNFLYNCLTSSQVSFLGDKVNKFSHKIQSVKNLDDLYLSVISTYQNPSEIVLDSKDNSQIIFDHKKHVRNLDFKSIMMFIDTQTYLSDDILTKVDRASMAMSLETRTPFLDKEVVELAWKIPTKMKINNKEGKLILKDILKQYLPQNLIDRPKMGFGIPLADWLRNDLKDWAYELIDENKIKEEGYFDSNMLKKLWEEHQSKKRDWQSILWPILMFQLWKKEN